jgi:hypothetical protein
MISVGETAVNESQAGDELVYDCIAQPFPTQSETQKYCSVHLHSQLL